MAAGGDRIRDLRVPDVAAGDIASVLVAIGEDLAKGRDIAFSVIVDGPARALCLAARDEAHNIGRQALLNPLWHAEAASVEIQVI